MTNLPVEVFVIAIVTIGFALDLWLVINGGVKNTISWWVITMAQRFPIIPFALGFLCGHFFWQLGCVK